MAQSGAYVPGMWMDVSPVVRVAGTVREHVSMSWASDSTGGLPEAVVSAGTGMRSITGSIVWAPSDVVALEPPHPLRRTAGWPPREGDEVTIDATYNSVTWRRFTGRIGRTTGSLVDGSLVSEITGTLGDRLRALCTVPPTVTSATHYTRSHWTMYGAIAQAGLGAIPGPDADTILWNGLQGGLRPLVGSFSTSGTEYGDGWGLSTWSDASTTPAASPARANREVLVLARAGTGAGSGTPAVKVTIGTQVITLTYTIATKTLTLHTTASGTVGAWAYVGDEPLAVLAFQISPTRTRVWTSRTTWVETTACTSAVTQLVTLATGTALAGVSVRYVQYVATAAPTVASTAVRPISITRSMLEQERITATRSVQDVTARSVVDAWSEATLASVWEDELGGVQAVGRDRLLARSSSRTVVVDERIFDGSWSIGDDNIRSTVIIKGTDPALQVTGRSGAWFLAYQESSNRAFDQVPSDPIERFVDIPSEQEWGPLDTSVEVFGDGHAINAGISGTWSGAVVVSNASGDQPELWAQTDSITVSTTVERLGLRTMKLTETISGAPSGKTLYLKTPDTNTLIHPAMRGLAMPTVRAEWVTTWADYTVTGTSKGPDWAEQLTIDTDWWLTSADAQRVADALAAEVTVSMPTLTGVSTLWDPRRQIGDVETWQAYDATGALSWEARVLVSGYRESWDGTVPEQSVDVRVVSWTDPIEGKTYGDLAAAYSTYAGMAGGTYAAVYDALPDSI